MFFWDAVIFRTGRLLSAAAVRSAVKTAGFIAQTNHDVTILEMRDEILMDMMPVNKIVLMDLNPKTGVRVLTDPKLQK